MKKKRDGASLLTTVVTAILCVFFVGGFAIGLSMVLDMEGTMVPVNNEPGLTAEPQNKEEAFAFLNYVLDKAQEEMPRLKTWTGFNIDDKTIETDGSEQFAKGLHYVKGNVEDCLAGSVETTSVDFFSDMSAVLKRPDITADNIESFTCECTYLECSSCGESNQTDAEACEECKTALDKEADLRFGDKYKITLNLVVDGDAVPAVFAPRSQEQILTIVNDAVKGKAELDKIDVEYTTLSIVFEVDRLTDKITSLTYQKGVNVSFDGTDVFQEQFASVQGGHVSFAMVENFGYSFIWPSLTLSDHYMCVEPKGSENLLATQVNDKTEMVKELSEEEKKGKEEEVNYPVTWVSSDESIVTIDQEGYFKAGKEAGKATITASFEFGGKTYTDTCEIEVKYSVERLSMNHKKVKLAVGETEQLAVKFTPSKATIQTVTWYSEDETVATVDANGVVTAVAPGKVTVYCLSDDGYFKSTSEVTVQ